MHVIVHARLWLQASLQEQGIEHIISCTDEEHFPDDFKYTSYDIPDDDSFQIKRLFEEVFNVISEVKVKNLPLLQMYIHTNLQTRR